MRNKSSEIQKPKALVLAFKNDYLNRTTDVFYEALAKVFDLFFYGPGYQPIEIIEEDVLKIYKKFGPFDLCFIDQYVLHNLIFFPKFLQFDSTNQYFAFDRQYFCNNLSNFAKNFNKIPCLKFLISLRTDCYAFTQKEQLEYELFKGYLIVPPPELISPVIKHINVHKEGFKYKPTDRFIKYCRKNKERIIPLPHVISTSEFQKLSLSQKRIDISVPGCSYVERKKAYAKLKEANLKPAVHLFLDKLVRYIEYYFKIKIGSSKYGVFFYRWIFSRLIALSKITFTDGSLLQAPVRKYFEIPALGSVLCAKGFYNYSALGFVAGKHFIETDSSTIVKKVKFLLKNPEEMELIINQSQSLIKERHSDIAWSKYMIEIYNKIKKGKFFGAKWNAGKLEY